MREKNEYNLDLLNVSELTKLISAAEEKRREKIDAAKVALLTEMQERAASLGLSIDDLIGRPAIISAPKARKTRKDANTPLEAKYRGPKGEEWSGRGRPPSWLVNLESTGKSRDDFLIQ